MSGTEKLTIGNYHSNQYLDALLIVSGKRFCRIRDVDLKHNFAFIEFSDPRDADERSGWEPHCCGVYKRDHEEATEPEADPEPDQRTLFAYHICLKADERDVYKFFSIAGKPVMVKPSESGVPLFSYAARSSSSSSSV